MRRRTRALALILVAAMSLLLAGGSIALGKQGVEAKLMTPVPLNTSPGETISVAWTPPT